MFLALSTVCLPSRVPHHREEGRRYFLDRFKVSKYQGRLVLRLQKDETELQECRRGEQSEGDTGYA
jgi:hypothetical protein